MADVRSITIRVVSSGVSKTFHGRFAWALAHLVAAGERGCTPIENPGPRWSHYVFILRREGLDIETIEEKHRGSYPGWHARYVLRTPVEIIETIKREVAA